MIPVSLSIKGLYSYQKEQHIDFGRLVDAQLFGIFGSVGSGKSSILEAISFALYGETERLNKADVRGYNMMNLKSDELFIDFIFKNHDEKSYRFVVRGKRNSKQFDKVNTFERNAYVMDGHNWLPLESNSAESILGLSYDNFRRTIIIPQGKFQEFLQLKEKERTDMLKEIFQLERFDFYAQAASLDRKNQEALLGILGNLKSYEHLSEEGILMQQQKLKELKEQYEQQSKQLDTLLQQFGRMEEQKKISDDFALASAAMTEIEKQSDHFKQLEEQVKRYDYCQLYFANLLRKKDLLGQTLLQRKQDHEIRTSTFNDLNNSLKNNELKLEEVRLYNEKNEEFVQQIADLEKLKQIEQLMTEVRQISSRIAEGKKYIDEATRQKQATEEHVKKLRELLRLKKEQLPDVILLSEVKQWHLSLHALQEQHEQQSQQVIKTEQELNVIEARFDNLKRAEGISVEYDVPAAEDWLEGQITRFKEDLQSYTEEFRHLEWQGKIADFANAIHDGEACPLCGSLDHPQVLEATSVNEHMEAVTGKQRVATENIEKAQKNLRIISEYKHQVNAVKLLYTNNLSLLEGLTKKLSAHQLNFTWEKLKDLSFQELEHAIQSAKEIQKGMLELESQLDQEASQLEKSTTNLDRYKQKLTSLEKEEAEKSFGVNQLRSQLKFLKYDNLTDYNIESKITELKEKIETNVAELKRVQELVEKQRSEKIRLTEQLESLNLRLTEEEQELKELQTELTRLFATSDFSSEQEVQAVLQEVLDSESVKQEIQQYHQRLYKTKEDYLLLKEKVQEIDYNEQLYSELKLYIEENNSLHKQLHQSVIEEDLLLKNQQKDWALKLELQQQAELLKLRSDELSVLKNMFKSNGFVSYISTVYLNNLCALANERFYPLSGQQLRLEVDDKNNFEVRDFMNEGRLRSVKTLSGGQTFQASLSLALALAESVQQQSKAQQNFFFLDEGFGSLDKESLLKAFDTLKSLRKENRVVGVISHVEDLQQEIDVFLRIENDPVNGTRVKGNWEY